MKIALFLLLALCGSTAFSQIQTVNIYFDKLSSVIRPEGITELENISKLLKADSTTIQSISVYTDTLGTVELNARLAQERYLNSLNVLGIKTNDVTFETNIYGEEFPFVESEYQIELFRRVTIVHFVKEEIIEEIVEEVIVEEVIEEGVEEVEEEVPSKLLTQLDEFALDPTKKEVLLQLSILFVGDKDVFLNGSTAELEELNEFLKANPKINAHIRGHVCCIPNSKLSKERAQRVYDYLIQNSIAASRLSYKGYSNKEPFTSPELSDADRQSNRRVDVIFTKVK
jgi:outer membrane protein OmpA-like peptidoglycan-associated protein